MKTVHANVLKIGGALLLGVATTLALGARSESDKQKGAGSVTHYTMLVQTNAKPGRETEFNEWYSKHHLQDVVAIPGFVSAQRFQWVESPGAKAPKYKYYAVYELQTDDVAAPLTELFRRSGTPQLPVSDAID